MNIEQRQCHLKCFNKTENLCDSQCTVCATYPLNMNGKNTKNEHPISCCAWAGKNFNSKCLLKHFFWGQKHKYFLYQKLITLHELFYIELLSVNFVNTLEHFLNITTSQNGIANYKLPEWSDEYKIKAK